MGNYRSIKLCEDDPDLFDEETSEITTSSGLIDFTLHRIVAHPFVILRRQCQVNAWSRKTHILPLSLVPVVYRLVDKHKIEALIKGIHGVLIFDLGVFVCDGLISVYSGLPSFAFHHQEWNIKIQYYAAKFLGACLVGPAYAAVVQATVQATQNTAHRNALDFLKLVGMRYSVWHIPGSGHPLRRVMPVWIVGPLYGCYFMAKLLIASTCQWRLFIWLKHRKDPRRHLPDIADHQRNEISMYLPSKSKNPSTKGTLGNLLQRYEARAVALIFADVLLYPVETVLNRLCIQGTKVAVDNLDTGIDAIPTVFSYRSPLQCATNILRTSGMTGFYKGIGVLFLQATLYAVLFGGANFLITYFDAENKKIAEKEE
ncbi:solute carrier family 25 member 46-A-like [Paramacrobiotus metropolitanus]|uniref:solute carrier family 25 member 46-A-like n=1 Tax=Paramacrobiotus metropolitanus TaxID=2943436 RepID=UPI002445E8FD|nr:solute carrier family 25 member 46-A-like [Paramacrobiotus metropolitanus]